MNRSEPNAARVGASKKARRLAVKKALTAAGAIAAGTHAYALPVRFDNPPHGAPGHYHWPGPPDSPAPPLDLTKPASEQPPDDPSAASARNGTFVGPLGGAGGAIGTVYPDQSTGFGVQAAFDVDFGAFFARSFDLDQPIPDPTVVCGGLPCFKEFAYLAYPGYGHVPEGVPAYVGVLWPGLHGTDCQSYNTCIYGWIGGVRSGGSFEVFAWGYDPTPGTPVPAGQATIGACCNNTTSECTDNVTDAECPPADTFHAGQTCAEARCIPTVSEWGMLATSLAVLAAGTWIVTKRKQLADTQPGGT